MSRADQRGAASQWTPDLDAVFDAEIRKHVLPRRKAVGEAIPPGPPIPDGRLSTEDGFGLGLVGLALSGGGIRSATFNLGVLQRLGKEGVLPRCDYLSTVSGGGYIGSCFTSLLSGGCFGMEAAKLPFRFDGPPERDEVRHLRRHSEYLAPRHGPLSRDTWRMISCYLFGALISVVTTVGLIAAVWAVVVWLYPLLLSLILRPIVGRWVDFGSTLWQEPARHLRALLLPAVVAFVLWVLQSVDYLLLAIKQSNWTIDRRRWRTYVAGSLLGWAAFLAVWGLLPWFFSAIHHSGNAVATFGAGLVVSGLPLLRAASLSKRGSGLLSMLEARLLGLAAGVFMFAILAGIGYVVWFNREHAIAILLGSVALTLLLTLIVDINRISMFYFYRDRLSEAYVFTRRRKEGGTADPASEPPIEANDELGLHRAAAPQCGAPYHLINAVVNVPANPQPELRWRKADFFLLSPLYCGSTTTGYRPTPEYQWGRMNLATAMTISGAATNPQAGPKVSPALGFLMALLNVRLGVWSSNPDPRHERGQNPLLRQIQRFWPYYLVKELFSLSSERDHFINLSDGGHLENLGMYELLRRHCRVIVASDASADSEHRFESLGNLIRMARIDLGIQIDGLDLDLLKPDPATGISPACVLFGEIRYPGTATRPATTGTLVYVRPTLVDGMPSDLLEYRKSHTAFPNETTFDQFFDEAQFESYRELGYRVARVASEQMRAKNVI